MGITIHYLGKLDDKEQIKTASNELTEIAKELEWKYELINDKKKGISGIVIKPHSKSESLSFIFDVNGELKNIVVLFHDDLLENDYSHVSIKTQFAPIEIHVTIIKLLRYLKKKFMGNLRVIDEGAYWDTSDEALLLEKFNFLNEMMDKLENELNKLDKVENESPESLADRIEVILKELQQRKN
ncbi:MAG TPA: hypothetical protein PKE39_06510 [Ignavibacteria bacterium]|nr:hypothetical protein [Ignavibacteria bacterium]HMQ98660.1 hypothetical protein [Ignavibacteria bacterium]